MTPLLDKLAAGEGLAASEIHAALRELETLDRSDACAMLRIYTHPRTGAARVQIVLPSGQFVITDDVRDALITARKLVDDPARESAA